MALVHSDTNVPAENNAVQCRVCNKSIQSHKALCIFSSPDETKGKNSARTIAELMGEFADVTINPEDGRSKHICLICKIAIEKAANLREQIRAAEKVIPTILQSLEIENITEQDYSLEYLEEFKDEIDAIPLQKTLQPMDETSLPDELLSEEEMNPCQDDMLEQGKLPFVMPSPELIGIRIEFEYFEYLEIRGERCCGCEHIATSRDALMAHAKDKHSQKYYADSSYTCPTCYQKFATAEALEKHSQYYLYSDVFLCTVCQEAYNSQGNLLRHLQQSHQLQQDQDQRSERDTQKRKPSAKQHRVTSSELTLPDAKFIKETRDYPQYRMYTVFGERCCACDVHVMDLEPHAAEWHIDMVDMLETSANERRCIICRQTFESRQEQILHEEERRNLKQIYQCKLCQMLFARKTQLLKHFQSTSKNRCSAVAANERKSTSHPKEGEPTQKIASLTESSKVDKVDYFCCCFTRCKEEYTCEKDLLDHARAMHGGRRKENESKLWENGSEIEENLICPVCRRMFGNEEKVRKHRSYKLTLPKETCRQCGRIFMKASGLREHQLREHLNLKPEFVCEVCGKHFVTRSTLTKHRRVHEPSQNCPCSADGCEAVFRNEQLMQRHYRNVHMEIKPYECAHCQKLFRTKESLDIHQRCHTGERPFACRFDGCTKRYAHGTDRKRHERSAHTGEKPHTCPVCNAGFFRKREMRLHVEKVHLCKYLVETVSLSYCLFTKFGTENRKETLFLLCIKSVSHYFNPQHTRESVRECVMMRFSKRRKVANTEENVASSPNHDDQSDCPRCCICSVQSKEDLLELSTIVENSELSTIAAIVEHVAGIKVKHVQKSICTGCWKKIQAAYSIQNEIRNSKCIEQQENDESDEQDIEHVYVDEEEFNTRDTDNGSDEQHLEKSEDKDRTGQESEYEIEYLEDNPLELADDKEQQSANDNELDIVIEISDEQQHEDVKPEYGKVTRQFKMPNGATIVNAELHEHYRVYQVAGERCCGCSFVAQTRKELLQHSETAHCVEINDYGDYCPICFYKFSTDQQLERHIEEFKLNKMFVCLRCNYFFNLRSQLVDHLQRCRQAKESGDMLPIESDEVDNDEVSIEPIQEDDDEFEEYYLQIDADTMEPHDARLQNAKDPRVMHCYKTLFEEILSDEKLSSTLTEAELNVQDTQIAAQHVFETFKYVRLRGLRCCGCSYTCFSSTLLVEHSKTSHPTEGNVVTDRSCGLCLAKFPNETELVKHWCFFITKQLFFCTVCDETFLNKESLRNHQRHNDRHRKQESHKLQRGNEIVGSEAFVEIDQPGVADELGKLLAEKITYRTKIIPMPDERFIKIKQEYNNYSTITVEGEYCCGCAKLFDTMDELRIHCKTEHYSPLNSRIYGHQCEFCYAVFDFERGLFMHNAIRRSKIKMLFVCKLCGMLFSKKFCLARHMQSAPNHLSRLIVDANANANRIGEGDELEEDSEASGSAPADTVESDPRVLEALQLHRSVEETGLEKVGHLVWYHCCFTKCTETFTKEEELLDHAQEEHNGQRRENAIERKHDANVCPACCKPFQTIAKLMWHRVKRFVPRKYPCKQCEKTFNSWLKLKMHVELDHSETPPSFPCPQCGKSFVVRSRLKAHLKIHSARKEHTCDVCGSSFVNKGLLKRHRRSLHSTDLLFECKLCSKKFAVVEKLKIHQRVHTGERPFECSYCPRTFLHFSDRKRHEMATHTGERPFKCKLCPASYIRNRELNLHMQKHKLDGHGQS
ncbi:zinc finger protein Xfin-like [Anopheles funestus]|uniref:zinc finger protein Xfin-like n=1 Tax=Anopheles funestus TaxID=62324 RepID=UPI0020C5C1CC|nr:zinc finger protein Xfin-like [Anopheles funestus]